MALTDAVEKVIPRKAKTLAKSRTVKGGAVVATAGISQMIEPIKRRQPSLWVNRTKCPTEALLPLY